VTYSAGWHSLFSIGNSPDQSVINVDPDLEIFAYVLAISVFGDILLLARMSKMLQWAIGRAIVAGERDARKLAQLRDRYAPSLRTSPPGLPGPEYRTAAQTPRGPNSRVAIKTHKAGILLRFSPIHFWPTVAALKFSLPTSVFPRLRRRAKNALHYALRTGGKTARTTLCYRATTGAGIASLVNLGIIWSRFATCHTAAATSADACFTSSGMMRS
jgi:hypothetical protein